MIVDSGSYFNIITDDVVKEICVNSDRHILYDEDLDLNIINLQVAFITNTLIKK